MDQIVYKQEFKQRLIKKVGPWAFQSYSKDLWINVSDRELICGTLLKAKPEDRHLLLEIYSREEILSVWREDAIIQDKWFHESNVWAAKNIFHAEDPEKFVRANYREARRKF